MRRLFAILLLAGFFCATLAGQLHIHKASDLDASEASCAFCQISATPLLDSSPGVLPVLMTLCEVEAPILVVGIPKNPITLLAISPKNSPPCLG